MHADGIPAEEQRYLTEEPFGQRLSKRFFFLLFIWKYCFWIWGEKEVKGEKGDHRTGKVERMGAGNRKIRKEVSRALSKVGLGHKARSMPDELSGY